MAKKKASRNDLKSFHFDCGDSSSGPVGFCARVTASSEEEAVEILHELINEKDGTFEVMASNVKGVPCVEYLTVYINPDEVTESCIDDHEDNESDSDQEYDDEEMGVEEDV